jgi:hypothetical protein
MPGKSITLDLPDDLYEQVRQVAAQSQRPVEHIVLESILLLFVPPPPSVDLATSLATLAVAACKQRHPNPQTRVIFGSHTAPTRGGSGSQSPPMSPHFGLTACKQPIEPTFAANTRRALLARRHPPCVIKGIRTAEPVRMHA